jgi:hypothetical protein
MTADLARGSIISGQTDNNRPTALDAKGDGKVLIGDGNDLKSVAVTGDVTITNAGATAIGATKVTTAMLAAALAASIQGTPTFTVGTEETNVCNVAVQLKDVNNVNIAAAHSVNCWLSDAAGGAPCAVAPDGTVVIGTDGAILASYTAKTHLQIATSAAGKFDLDITESGVKTLYVNVEYQGKIFSSGVVTFASE